MKIYITRHGQTDYNNERKVCGITDINLNKTGRSQAETLKQTIEDKKLTFDYIFVSSLKRARQTVAPIEKLLNQKAIIDERLREFNFGDDEGCDFYDPEFRRIRRDPFLKFPNGESMIMAASRVYSFLDELLATYENDSTILIVSHATTSKLINSYFNSISLEDFYEFKVKNCQLLEYEI